MPITLFPDIDELLALLLSKLRNILEDNLVGLYLYGSLVWGDFDYDISDIDLLTATARPINDSEFNTLKQMHDDFALHYERWNGRIEVQYFSLHGLKTFKSQSTKMGNISPGEPFHIIEAGKAWLMNWYFVQDYGVTLFGPSPKTLIDPISKQEFIQAVRDHAKQWRGYVIQSRNNLPYQSYAILTLCRALYTAMNSEQVSKSRAALWAAKQFPEWSTLIENALIWRKDGKAAHAESAYPQTERFVHFMIDQIIEKA